MGKRTIKKLIEKNKINTVFDIDYLDNDCDNNGEFKINTHKFFAKSFETGESISFSMINANRKNLSSIIYHTQNGEVYCFNQGSAKIKTAEYYVECVEPGKRLKFGFDGQAEKITDAGDCETIINLKIEGEFNSDSLPFSYSHSFASETFANAIAKEQKAGELAKKILSEKGNFYLQNGELKLNVSVEKQEITNTTLPSMRTRMLFNENFLKFNEIKSCCYILGNGDFFHSLIAKGGALKHFQAGYYQKDKRFINVLELINLNCESEKDGQSYKAVMIDGEEKLIEYYITETDLDYNIDKNSKLIQYNIAAKIDGVKAKGIITLYSTREQHP